MTKNRLVIEFSSRLGSLSGKHNEIVLGLDEDSQWRRQPQETSFIAVRIPPP